MIIFIRELIENISERINILFRRRGHINLDQMPIIIPDVNLERIAQINNIQRPNQPILDNINAIQLMIERIDPALLRLINRPNDQEVREIIANVPPNAQGYNPGDGRRNGFVFFPPAPAANEQHGAPLQPIRQPG